MSEWWSYRLSDFLMFSPSVYWRLIALHNEAVWPLHVVAVALGLATLALVLRPPSWQGRAIVALFAAAWAWVAWSFLWSRYATINWAIVYVAPLFAIEAALLAWAGFARPGLRFRLGADAASVFGAGLSVYALLLHPLVGTALRGPTAGEVFAIVADPTAMATLGLVLLAEGRARWELLAIPVLWCLLSAATLSAMAAPEAWIVLAAAAATVAAAALRAPPRGATRRRRCG